MSGYLTRQEFFAAGLPAKAFTSSPQVVAAADSAADVLTVPGHGFGDGDVLRLTVNPGGAGLPPGVLPAGLSASTLYYALTEGSDLLKVALTSGGSAVDFTDAGTPLFMVTKDPGPAIDTSIEFWSRHADQHLKAYSTPLASAPSQLKMWIAHLVAADLAITSGLVDPVYARDPELVARAGRAQKQLDMMQSDGEELAGVVVDQTPAVLENAAVAWSDDPRCWTPGGML